jgi:hypothetical protein
MKPVIFLRIASVLAMIHSVLHTVGGVFGKPTPGVAAMVAATMQDNRFPALGQMRSYADFYRGMGLGVTIFLTAEAIVFWFLASLIQADGVRLRPILCVFAAGYLAFALNSYAYFFMMPVIVETLIAACLIMSAVTAKSQTAAQREVQAVQTAH